MLTLSHRLITLYLVIALACKSSPPAQLANTASHAHRLLSFISHSLGF